jgi:hypothetical protein
MQQTTQEMKPTGTEATLLEWKIRHDAAEAQENMTQIKENQALQRTGHLKLKTAPTLEPR